MRYTKPFAALADSQRCRMGRGRRVSDTSTRWIATQVLLLAICGFSLADSQPFSNYPPINGAVLGLATGVHIGEPVVFSARQLPPETGPIDFDTYEDEWGPQTIAEAVFVDWTLDGGDANQHYSWTRVYHNPWDRFHGDLTWYPDAHQTGIWTATARIYNRQQANIDPECRLCDTPTEWGPFQIEVLGPNDREPPAWYLNRVHDGDPVDLLDGGEDYTAPVDIRAYNRNGMDAIYQRTYHSQLQSSSIGLRNGWVDNFHAKIVPILVTGLNDDLEFETILVGCNLVYPNGSYDYIEYVEGVNPFHAPKGAPYVISRDQNGSFRVIWKDLTQWVFDYNAGSTDGSYPLQHVTNRAGHTIDIVRNLTANGAVNGRIESIRAGGSEVELLHFEYGGQSGYPNSLSRITDMTEAVPANRRWVAYLHDGTSANTVSEIKSPAIRWRYSYTTYEDRALLTQISEPGPTSTDSVDTYITYDSLGRVLSTHDGKGNTRTYDYEASYTPPGCATTFTGTRVDVGKDSQIVRSWIQMFDPKTKFATGTYDSGRQTKIEYGTHDYDWMYPVSVTDENGRVVSYAWDPQGHGTLASFTVPSTTRLGAPTSTVTGFTYSYIPEFPYLTQICVNSGDIAPTGEQKSPTWLNFDDHGNLSTISTPVPGTVHATGSSVTSFTYANGFLETINPPVNAGPNLPTITFGYSKDGNGNVTSKRPNTVSVRTVAAGNGQPIVFSLQWNSDGTLASVVDAQGAEVDYVHYANGAIKDVISKWANGTAVAKTTFAYDHLGGRLTDIETYGFSNGVQALLAQVHHDYDDAGNFAGASGDTEPFTLERDPLGRVTSLTDASDHSTAYGYGSGILSPETDAVTTASASFPGAPGASPPFDTAAAVNYHAIQNGDPLAPLDRNIDALDGKGVKRTYVYAGSNGELTDVLYTDTLNPVHDISANNLHFTYDLYGQVTTQRHGTSDTVYQDKTEYTYDDLGNVLTKTTRYNSGSISATFTYTYYADGRRASMATPTGTFGYTYDLAGRLTGLSTPFAGQCAWEYLNNGWLAQQSSFDGFYRTYYSYDARGFISQVQNTSSAPWLYSWFHGITRDAVGNITGLTADHSTGSPPPPPPPPSPLQAQSPGRAVQPQLIIAPPPFSYSGTTTYSYAHNAVDPLDQCTAYGPLRLEETFRFGGFSRSYAYDPAFNATRIRGTGAVTYNADNQRTGTGYAYDGNGSPTQYAGISGLQYDVENRLSLFPSAAPTTFTYGADGLRTSVSRYGATTYFIYDNGLPVLELNGSGAVAAVNTFGPNGLISRWSMSTGGTWYQFDPMGNVANYNTNLGGTTPIGFDAYGNPVSTQQCPFGFQAQWGAYTDSSTNLVLMGHRFYSRATCRFLTRDPIGYAGGVNLYAYCRNNPVNYADPLGLCSSDYDEFADADEAERFHYNKWNGARDTGAFAVWLALKGETAVAEWYAYGPLYNLAGKGVAYVGGKAVGAASGAIGRLAKGGEEAGSTAEQLSRLAKQAASEAGAGSGRVYGTNVHSAFKRAVNALDNPQILTERSFLNGREVTYGTPGSIRVDVLVGSVTNPTAIYDLKTGSAVLTQARTAQILSHLPNGGEGVSVYVLKP